VRPVLDARRLGQQRGGQALMGDPEPIPRVAGRVLVLDPACRVLLLECFDPARPERHYWMTIGGGLDDGEGTADAAVRELREEAGIAATVADLTGPVWRRVTEFSFDGRLYRQDEEYYLLRVGEVTVSFADMEAIELETVTSYRWWSAAELATTQEEFYPSELPGLLRSLDS
jgi:8-oxo-dGTP pyrophosphatase MutT (NUDIX family)